MLISNLVLEGGGVGAIAYAGFLLKAESENILSLAKLKRVAGVSSGAIGAMQLALNYSAEEILTVMETTDFLKFSSMSSTFLADQTTFDAEYLYIYLQKLISDKTAQPKITFAELHAHKNNYKDLYVVATKLFIKNNTPQAEAYIFSHEHTPNACVVDAVRASAALPILFSPMRLLKNENDSYVIHPQGDIYIDGGLVNNFPIRIFDDPKYYSDQTVAKNFNPETLGLRLHSTFNPEYETTTTINNPFQYATALLYLLNQSTLSTENLMGTEPLQSKRMIAIDTLGIASTQFHISMEQKQALFASGENATSVLLD